jgi:transcriptional regulator with XRE-family HTH domain
MDTVRAGRQLRALRHRQRLRQSDVSNRARVSRSDVGRAERGHADRMKLATLERIATALGARVELRLSWNGEALDRLMDAGHAALVEIVVRSLQDAGWECAVAVSFNIRGERGSVDVLAFHAASRTALIVEVKSVVPDVQATLMTLDRKARLGKELAGLQGWSARGVGRLLVVGESRTSRRRIEAHETVFRATLPARAVEIRRWLHLPTAERLLAGLWFLSSGHRASTRHRIARPLADEPGRHARGKQSE